MFPWKRRTEKPADVELPITPFLDMSFQLMAFFIFTFRPMPQEGQMALRLPSAETASGPIEPPPNPFDDEVESYRVVVQSADGAIGGIALHRPAGVTPMVGEGDARIRALTDNLRAIARPSGRSPRVKIEAASELRYVHLIRLLDACRSAGIDNVGVGRHE